MDRSDRSTHHVHRGPESLPCYCAATSDHPIGSEAPPPPAEQASGELAHAVDLMRDVYMSKAQREAYERILAAALSQRPVVDDATLRQALHAMKRCATESGGKAWEPWIANLQRALAPQQPEKGEG